MNLRTEEGSQQASSHEQRARCALCLLLEGFELSILLVNSISLLLNFMEFSLAFTQLEGLCIIYFSVAVKECHDQGNLEDLAWVYSSRGLCQSRPRGMAVGRHGGRNRKLSDTPRMKQRANCKFTKAVCSQSSPPVTCSLQQGSAFCTSPSCTANQGPKSSST